VNSWLYPSSAAMKSSLSSLWKGADDLLAGSAASGFLEKAKAAAKDVAVVANKVSDVVQSEYQRTFVDLDCTIIQVRPNIQVMEFPADDCIDRLATRLNANHAQKMMILNLSEKTYMTSKFDGKVVAVNFHGLPVPPLKVLVDLCISAQSWLETDPANVLILHGSDRYDGPALFLGCFMTMQGLYDESSEALQESCKLLKISAEEDVSPSQRRYLTYFQRVIQGKWQKCQRLCVLRTHLNTVPRFEKEGGSVAFRPSLEIWCGGGLKYSSLGSGDEDFVTLPAEFCDDDACVSFQLPSDMYLDGDVMICIQHMHSDGTRELAVRFVFHTGCLPDGFQLQLAKSDLDCACFDDRFPDESFLDLIFEREDPERSKSAGGDLTAGS